MEVGGRLSEVRGRPLMASRPLAAVVGRLPRRGRRGGVGRRDSSGSGEHRAWRKRRGGEQCRSERGSGERRAGVRRARGSAASGTGAASERLGYAGVRAPRQRAAQGSGASAGRRAVRHRAWQRRAARARARGTAGRSAACGAACRDRLVCAHTRARVASWRRARVPRRGQQRCTAESGDVQAGQAGLGRGAAQGGLARSRVRSRERGCACGRGA